MPLAWIASLRRTSAMGEEELAAAGVVLAITAATGGMVTLFALFAGDVSPLLIPTVALVANMAARRTVTSAWIAVGVWILVLPLAADASVVAPLMMACLCATLAVGPDRVGEWLFERPSPPPVEEDEADAPGGEPPGWIEEL